MNFIKKETLVKVISCVFYEISKNTFFTEHLWATASQSSVGKTNTLFQWTKFMYKSWSLNQCSTINLTQAIETNGGQVINEKNLLWVLARMQHVAKQIIPNWTGFNHFRCKQSVQENIGCLPTTNTLVMRMATIHEMLC